MNDKKFLTWIYGRLVNIHNEPEDIDYMIRFKDYVNSIEGVKG